MPLYDELANTPLWIWDPRSQVKGVARQSLVQTIDIPATLLDFFDAPRPAQMQGHSMTPVIQDDAAIRDRGLFGYFGQMTCLIYGDYILMRAPQTPDNTPLYQYTWMLHQTHGVDIGGDYGFTKFSFSKDMPVPRVPVISRPMNVYQREDLLFNMKADPGQEHPLEDLVLKEYLLGKMAELMRQSDAPEEQFIRMGLSSR
jgi:arylsulfatase A-like enzyme